MLTPPLPGQPVPTHHRPFKEISPNTQPHCYPSLPRGTVRPCSTCPPGTRCGTPLLPCPWRWAEGAVLLLRLLFKSKQGLCLAQIGSHTATPAADRGMNLRWGSCTQGRVTAAGPPLLPKHPYRPPSPLLLGVLLGQMVPRCHPAGSRCELQHWPRRSGTAHSRERHARAEDSLRGGPRSSAAASHEPRPHGWSCQNKRSFVWGCFV